MTSFFSSPFEMPFDSPLNCSPLTVQAQDTTVVHVPCAVQQGYDMSDGTTITDPAAWEYWVWERHIDYISSRYYYYSPHYNVSTYDIPEREGSEEEYEDVVIKDTGATIWYKHYRGVEEYPHTEAYYHNRETGEIRVDMPKSGYVQVLRDYETIDAKGVRRTYISVQFPRLPPVYIQT